MTKEELIKAFGLLPPFVFAAKSMIKNYENGLMECNGMRATGRTTSVLIDAIYSALQGKRVVVFGKGWLQTNNLGDVAKSMLDEVKDSRLAYRQASKYKIYLGTGQIEFLPLGYSSGEVNYVDSSSING